MHDGEFLYCIKDVYCDEKICHKKNNLYEICGIRNFFCDGEYLFLYSEPDTTPNGYLGFFVKGNIDTSYNWSILSDHFVDSVKYFRSLKLKKLNEKN